MTSIDDTANADSRGHDADLVVVGYGAAGAATALTAAAAGASVVILEKQPRDGHTCSTRMSGGFIFGVNDVDRAAAYMDVCAGGMIPSEVNRAWAEKALTVVEWHDAFAMDLQLRRVVGGEQPFEGADAIDVYQQGLLADGRNLEEMMRDYGEVDMTDPHVWAAGGSDTAVPVFRYGFEYFEALSTAVAKQPRIQIRWGSPARSLIQADDGRVTGVEYGADRASVSARCGVVLTCGGYEFDESLKLNYLRAYPIHFYGNPGNTGDGIRMAQKVGADLWHMNQMIGRAIGHFELPDGTALNFPIHLAPAPYLITDKHGLRIADEYPQAMLEHSFYYHLLHYDADARDYPRIPCYWFFDDTRLSAGPLSPPAAGVQRVGLYDWSADNSREIERGWIATGASIEEAARNAGITDPQAAAATVAEFNACCEAGEDPYGRPADTLLPLTGPRYYCVALYPGGSNTAGGPRRNERAEIVDAFGDPIPGLYGAGELGQAYGLLYPAGGGNLSDANCFGRIAAQSALGLTDDPVVGPGAALGAG